jgi:hypothetical protein
MRDQQVAGALRTTRPRRLHDDGLGAYVDSHRDHASDAPVDRRQNGAARPGVCGSAWQTEATAAAVGCDVARLDRQQ